MILDDFSSIFSNKGIRNPIGFQSNPSAEVIGSNFGKSENNSSKIKQQPKNTFSNNSGMSCTF